MNCNRPTKLLNSQGCATLDTIPTFSEHLPRDNHPSLFKFQNPIVIYGIHVFVFDAWILVFGTSLSGDHTFGRRAGLVLGIWYLEFGANFQSSFPSLSSLRYSSASVRLIHYLRKYNQPLLHMINYFHYRNLILLMHNQRSGRFLVEIPLPEAGRRLRTSRK